MHQQILITVSFYTIITAANMYQLNINTECSYSVITANLNTSLPPYIYICIYIYIYTYASPSTVLCFFLVMMTQLWYHHNSHTLLSTPHNYHKFSSPVNTKQTFNTHYDVQCILYTEGMILFKSNLMYIACPCKCLSLSLTHTYTHVHCVSVCVYVCMYIYVCIYTHIHTHTIYIY